MNTGNDICKSVFGMSSGALEVIKCLFFHGPTWDGDIPSKQGRRELIGLGYAEHEFGHAWLTGSGMKFAITSLEMDKAKENWRNNKRRIGYAQE
jgi:hypothetical protein